MQDFPLASVDLIYLDPPFNSNRAYNAIYKDETGRPLPDQIEAFCDMWELDAESERAIRNMPVLMRKNGIDDAVAEFWRLWMRALRDTQPRLLAYLSYMAQRLLVMHRILKPTGSLYLHCDPTASHYIKHCLTLFSATTTFVMRSYGGAMSLARRAVNTPPRVGAAMLTICYSTQRGTVQRLTLESSRPWTKKKNAASSPR